MSVFVTGGTGFLGSYAVAELLRSTHAPVFVMVRAPTRERGIARLWEALQVHLDEEQFRASLDRLVPMTGDLHAPDLGMAPADRERVLAEADSVLHIAASLNRKSDRACFNSNLRGTLSVVKLGLAMAERGTLTRFTDVSTSAVAGVRERQVVGEDDAIDWDRSDYDPYARTKKFAEHLCRELLPTGSVLTLRPSTVMGDSRRDDCWVTDMVVATAIMADLPLLPLDPDTRLDFVAGDWVGHGIARLHLATDLEHPIYHLSSGTSSSTGRSIDAALRARGQRLRFAPRLARSFHTALRGLDRLPRSTAQRAGAVMKVFWPYITNDVVFDNTRAVEVLGPPPPFGPIVPGMIAHAKRVKFRNERRPWLG